jgi:hypothetical protein
LKYDVFTLIIDSNSAFANNALAFRSVISDHTHNDSTIVVISANNSIDRIIAGTDTKSLTGIPALTNRKAKADNADEVFAWLVETQCMREADGKKSQKLGVLVDFDTSKHKALLVELKAKKELSIVEAITPKSVQSAAPPLVVKQSVAPTKPIPKQKTWRDFKGAFATIAVLSLLVGSILGIPGFHYINEKYPNTIFKEQVKEIVISPEEVVLELGRTAQLSPLVMPDDAVDTELSYISSNEKVVTISKTGLITATKGEAFGKDRIATITVSASNGVTADVMVTVKDSYHAAYADASIQYGSATTTPLVFTNIVPRCTGFTWEFKISEITEGDTGNFEGQEFVVLGRASNEGSWKELGRVNYGEIGVVTKVEMSFVEMDLGQVICVMGDKSFSGRLSWKGRNKISDVQYAD